MYSAGTMLLPSRLFIETLKLHRDPAYQIAWRAGVHPNTLSKLISGYLRVRLNDPRLIAVGRELGLEPEDCFETAIREHSHAEKPHDGGSK
jgi:hypothetical protein